MLVTSEHYKFLLKKTDLIILAVPSLNVAVSKLKSISNKKPGSRFEDYGMSTPHICYMSLDIAISNFSFVEISF